MPSNSYFPFNLDTFVDPGSSDPETNHAAEHDLANDAIQALENVVGVNGSTVPTSHDYLLRQKLHNRGAWQANTTYLVNDVVTYQSVTYVCQTEHTSGVDFVATNWQNFGVDPPVTSVFGRTGAVYAEVGDYNILQVTNGVGPLTAGSGVSLSGITGAITITNTGVLSFNGRTGAVVPTAGDYSVSQITNAAQLTGGNTFSGEQIIVGSSPASVVAIIRGASAQTGNLMQWQDNSGNVLSYVDNAGSLSLGANSLTVGQILGGLTNTHLRPAGLGSIGFTNAAGTLWGLWVTDPASGNPHTGTTNNVLDDGSGNLTTVGYGKFSNGVIAGPDTDTTAFSRFSTNNPADKGLVIRGATSQTADLQQWQNDSGTVLAKVDASGNILAPTGYIAGNKGIVGNALSLPASIGNYLMPGLASNVGLVIQGMSSQTANLQQWENNAGSTLAFVDASGVFTTYAGGTAFYAQNGAISAGYSINAGTYLAVNAGGFAPSGQTISIFRASSGQTADLASWQNNVGTGLSGVSSDGAIYLVNGSYRNPARRFELYGDTQYNLNRIMSYAPTGQVPATLSFTVFGADAPYQTPTDVFSVTPQGNLRVTGSVTGNNGVFQPASTGVVALTVSSGFSTNVGLVVRGAASQSADLQQWQNSSNANLARIDSAGNIVSNSSYETAVKSVTTNYVAGTNDRYMLTNASSGAINVTLPAATLGKIVTIKKIDSSPNYVTLLPPTGATLDGATSFVITATNTSIDCLSDGANWYII